MAAGAAAIDLSDGDSSSDHGGKAKLNVDARVEAEAVADGVEANGHLSDTGDDDYDMDDRDDDYDDDDDHDLDDWDDYDNDNDDLDDDDDDEDEAIFDD